MTLDAATRRRAHEACRRLTGWDDLTIDRALRDPRPLRRDSVIVVNSCGGAVITAQADRRAW